MMKSPLFALPLVMAALAAGCSSPTAESLMAEAASAEESARAKAESVGDAASRSALFEEPLGMYARVRSTYPGTPEAREALFRTAAIYNNDTRQFPEAIAVYKEYVREYPEGEKAAVASFLIGYLYSNELGMLDSAEAAYRGFLERYPDHELSASAQFELNTLGKSPEELLPPEEELPPQTAARKGGKRL